jgi:protein-S-isoprenylcysteine O-methyltransferase Ste14
MNKETVELMRFLRHDPVGQRFGVAILVVAWLALAWTSLSFAVAVPLLLAISEVVRRRREEEVVVDDLEDLY